MKILKMLINPRVASAVVSAVSAVICAVLAGCKLCVGSLSLDEFEVSLLSAYDSTTNAIKVIEK